MNQAERIIVFSIRFLKDISIVKENKIFIKRINENINRYGVGTKDKGMDLWTQAKEVIKTPSIHSW